MATDYEHNVPRPHDVHMKLAGIQIVQGLMDPKRARGETTIIRMLPKKIVPPPFQKEMGSLGWGLYGKMGFSVRKFVWWLVACFLANAAFVTTWLFYISSTDLQNAFVPATVVTGALTIGLAVVQLLENQKWAMGYPPVAL